MMVVHLVGIITRVIVRVHLHDDTIHDAINENDDTEIFKNHVFSPKSPRAVVQCVRKPCSLPCIIQDFMKHTENLMRTIFKAPLTWWQLFESSAAFTEKL
jgi:hypothetical protein